MVVIGAKGLAKELLQVLYEKGVENIYFFDDVNIDGPDFLYEKFSIIRSLDNLTKVFLGSPDFVVGFGGTDERETVYKKIISLGGTPASLISNNVSIGSFGTKLAQGVIILTGAIVTNDVFVGEGTLINKSVIISHDVSVGMFCEISPGARILGRVKVGDYTSIGTNAVLLPDVEVGKCCVIGAGSVVTKSIPDNSIVMGVPGKIKNV